MTSAQWVRLLTIISSGGLAAIVTALGNAIPKDATLIGYVAAIIGGVAAVILQVIQPVTATAIAADAPVVAPDGTVVGTNVSTTSTLPIAAPPSAATPQK